MFWMKGCRGVLLRIKGSFWNVQKGFFILRVLAFAKDCGQGLIRALEGDMVTGSARIGRG